MNSTNTDLVALELLVLAGERDVDEPLRGEEFWEGVAQVRLVTVPADAELLRDGGGRRHRGWLDDDHLRVKR